MAEASQTVHLYERLREGILSLALAPGEKLTERGIEELYGASRTPARAALMRLHGEGLVRRDGRGWRVAPIDLAEIRDLAEFREAVEAQAVRLAAERASDADIAAVAELLESARPVRDEEEGVRAGGDFHGELARLSGNGFFADAVVAAMTRMSRTRWLEVRTPEAREQAWSEHRAVLDAVAARDGETAALLVARHVRETNRRLLDVLDGQHAMLRAHGVDVIAAP